MSESCPIQVLSDEEIELIWSEKNSLLLKSKLTPYGMERLRAIESAILAKLADQLKDAEDADSMILAMKAVIDKDDARWKFLHTTNKDAEGFEWCVLRVKWENGRISEALHTNQNLKDLDAAIDSQKGNQ